MAESAAASSFSLDDITMMRDDFLKLEGAERHYNNLKRLTEHSGLLCPEFGENVRDDSKYKSYYTEKFLSELIGDEAELVIYSPSSNYFNEFEHYIGNCRYTDCTHTKEEECAVAEAVRNGMISASRFNSYKRLYEELKNIKRYK